MPPKGKGKGKGKKKGNSKKTKNRAPDPTSIFYIPRTSISNILSRLSVKTLLMLRCVCRKWRSLISNPNFIATHFQHSSSLQRINSSILIYTRHIESYNHTISLYNPPESVVELENPFPCFIPHMFIVGGPINGIVCLFQPPWGDMITLWNPAMRQSRMVKLSENKPIQDLSCFVSVALAFDSQKNDLLILRIFCLGTTSTIPYYVEMCSTKSFEWKELKSDMDFQILRYSCDAIIKGVPYWMSCITDIVGTREALVRFDVGKMVFERLPVPVIRMGDYNQCVTNFQDSLGYLMWEERDGYYIDVWVMDELEGWSNKRKIGPLFGCDRILGCLCNGDIVAGNDGVMILYDPITCSVKAELRASTDTYESYLIFNYSESLVLIEGMLPVKRQDSLDVRKNLFRDCQNFLQW